MHEPETLEDRRARLFRLAEHLMNQVRAGHHPSKLREHLEVAIMMSPLSSADSEILFVQFENVVVETASKRNAAPRR